MGEDEIKQIFIEVKDIDKRVTVLESQMNDHTRAINEIAKTSKETQQLLIAHDAKENKDRIKVLWSFVILLVTGISTLFTVVFQHILTMGVHP